ncbi:MAG: YkgJ family cysteine cluster protein [Cryobacterium sp.]|nr:YkgJ family cysteine cluster protein [Oligoflexia bacterium]
MPVSIDRPSTWVPFRSGKQCSGCFAGCCTLPVEASAADLIRLGVLSEDEAASSLKKSFRKLHKEGIIRSYHAPTGLFIIEQRNGRDCYFLHPKTRLCTVYEKRPEVCRMFPKIGPRPGYCPKTINE